jgi:hypothetical protein
MNRTTAVDVAIDPRGNVVVAWAAMERISPPRASVMTVRRSGGYWSAPHRIATFSSPRSGVGVAPFKRGLRPQMMLDANGAGVAVWARLVTPEPPEGFDPATATYVVDAVTMNADGVWSTPRTLGETNGFPDLDVAASGEAVAVWTGTMSSATPSTNALVVAMRPPGGTWAPPEILVGDAQLVDGIPVGPGGFFGPQIALEPGGRATALWTSSAAHIRLETATRHGTRQWSSRRILDRTLGSPTAFLDADRRGDVTAVWMTRAVGGSNDQALWATTQGRSGSWSPPTSVVRRSPWTRLTDVAMSASGRVIALIERETYGGGEWRTQRIEAYVRTPGHAWSRRHVVSRVAAADLPRWRSQRAQAALADDGGGVIVWSFDAGVGHRPKVMCALIASS